MKIILGIAGYLLVTAAIVGGGTVLVSASRDTAPPVMARGTPADTSPRIQAWLDRLAENKVYEERARLAALAEAERDREVFSRKLPTIAEQAAMVKAREGKGQEKSQKVDRTAERARSAARREATRQTQRRDADVAYAAQGFPSPGFAPPSGGGYGRTAYDVMRDRGGL